MNPRSFPLIFILSFALILALTPPADAETPASQWPELITYIKKMNSYATDLGDIGNGLSGPDATSTMIIMGVASHNGDQILHVHNLLSIYSMLKDDGDKRRTKAVISICIKTVTDGIDLDIKRINLGLTYQKNPAVVTAATNLKDDLRALKELILKF